MEYEESQKAFEKNVRKRFDQVFSDSNQHLIVRPSKATNDDIQRIARLYGSGVDHDVVIDSFVRSQNQSGLASFNSALEEENSNISTSHRKSSVVSVGTALHLDDYRVGGKYHLPNIDYPYHDPFEV